MCTLKREIPLPQSLLSVPSLRPVQSREQLINPVLVCDGSIYSLVSASLLTQGKVEQMLRTVSFQGHCLPYLFIFHSATGALVGSLQLVHPKASPSASTNCCSPPFPRLVMEKLSSSPLENALGCCIHKQVTITQTCPGLSPQDPGVPQRGHKTMLCYTQ